jgi:hypothetical protein
MDAKLRALFSRENLIRRLQGLPVINTVVMDEVFPRRPQLPSANVPVEDVATIIRTMPLIHRGGASLAMRAPGRSVGVYEPLAISINISISAADLNTLRQYDAQGLEAWANTKTDLLRQTIRRTTEGMAAQAVNGKIAWPIQLDAGTDIYTVDWGKPLAVTAPKKLDAADAGLSDVVAILTQMRKALRRKGFGGGAVKVWAGEDAYTAILKLCQDYKGDAIRVEIQESCIIVAGVKIVLRSEEYPDPVSKNTWVPVLTADTLRMIDTGGGHKLPYCALDDLDAKLAPLPFFVKPIKQDDPSGYKLVAQSKPFPVPNHEAMADCEVV